MRVAGARPILSVVAAGMVIQPARADEASLSLVKAFATICMMAVPDFAKVELMARVKGWESAKSEPVPDMVGAAWIVRDATTIPVMLKVDHTPIAGDSASATTKPPVSACTVTNADVSQDAAIGNAKDILALADPAKTEVEEGRRFASWQMRFTGRNVLVILTDRTPSHQPGVILTAIVEGHYP